jgi:hypothetical protein
MYFTREKVVNELYDLENEVTTMSYEETISALGGDAEQLEALYQGARQAGETAAFQQAIDANYTTAPDNLLYAAWFHRLKYGAEQVKSFTIVWGWVIPLALLNGLLFWWLSDEQRYVVRIVGAPRGEPTDYFPTIVLLAGPIAAAFMLTYLTAVGRKQWRLSAPIALLLLAAAVYVLGAYPQVGTRPFQEQYLTLMALHLPLLSWAGVGVILLAPDRSPAQRFAFLMKSLELFIVGGLFVMAGGLFTAITVGLFSALDVEFPTWVQRLFFAGGGGLIPVVATAVIYNPTAPPAGQAFEEGLSKLVALLMRILLPLTLLVLLVYILFIPFNFRAPFDNREVLIIYNAMLFAVIALLAGATPLSLADGSPRLMNWLRRGITAVAALTLLVSLYALGAILYRTALDRLTPNRLVFIGWNLINIGLLILLLVYPARARAGRWLPELYRAYSAGTVAYAAWTLVTILAVPWLFGVNQGEVAALPIRVQEVIFEHPMPILLKCTGSPHIYLLDRGEKRWIENIETFNQRGYVWRDVRFISCDDLRSIPDGVPIPAGAGPPPQP